MNKNNLNKVSQFNKKKLRCQFNLNSTKIKLLKINHKCLKLKFLFKNHPLKIKK